MSLRNIAFALASASLLAAPVAAQAAQTAPVARAAAPTTEANELGLDLTIFAVIAALVILWAVLESDNNNPVSP